jgi:hypothetical protein
MQNYSLCHRNSNEKRQMQLTDRDAVAFLWGENTVRDGYIVSLSIREVDWEPVVTLVFRTSTEKIYNLELSRSVTFDYNFSSEYTPYQIGFVKCIWTEDDYFYLSLDPWLEREAFVSEQDTDWFKSKSVKLTVIPESG